MDDPNRFVNYDRGIIFRNILGLDKDTSDDQVREAIVAFTAPKLGVKTGTIIEVGANWGYDALRFAKDGGRVYAFEPTPVLAEYMKDVFRAVPSIDIIEKAVDIEEKYVKFNIAGYYDWGCSSLYEFVDNVKEGWTDTFSNRPDFHFTDSCTVECIRLDTFIKQTRIDVVHYLHIDAQGNDFRVLQSLGDEVARIQSGKCEVVYTQNLYKDTDNTQTNVVPWLAERGFKCTIVPHDHLKEADVYFERKRS